MKNPINTFIKILLVSLSVHADGPLPLPEYVVLSPSFAVKDKELNINQILQQCSEMKFNYESELMQFQKIQLELEFLRTRKNFSQDELQRLQVLKTQAVESMQRLNHLAKPLWNEQRLEVKLVWSLDYKKLYDESDFSALKDKLHIEGFSSLNSDEQKKWLKGNTLKFIDEELQNISMNAKGRPDLAEHYIFGWPFSGKTFHFSFIKRVTLLEFCQSLPTLYIKTELKIEYKVFDQIKLIHPQKIILQGISL